MAETILTLDQQKVLDMFRTDKKLSEIFYLTGGTALAEFYLKHRLSDDLDFFTQDDFPLALVENFVGKLCSEMGREARFQKLYDRRMFFLKSSAPKGTGELKIEFTKYPFARLADFQVLDGLKIDSLLDIGSNKLMAMIDRFEPKDFADLYFLLNGNFKLDELVDGVNKKFGFKIEFLTLGSELMKAERISFLPKMVKELNVETLKSFFVNLASELRPRIVE